MDRVADEATWKPTLQKDAGPLYQAIADALAADIASGKLSAGVRLPPQRSLAHALGIDFTTVSRAYAEARRRGLVDAFVGQGTFVRRRVSSAAPASSGGLIDMSMNLPPAFDEPALAERLWSGFRSLEESGGLDLLLRYQEPGGAHADRSAGADWLSGRIPDISADRVVVCPGAQGALLAVAGLLAGPGEVICTESLTYAGFRSLAAHLRIQLAGIAMDGEGLLPDAFEAACRKHSPKALYCTPTLHNPTTATMSPARREAIIAIAREHNVPIIEDDAYGALVPGVAPLAALAPDIVYHIAGLAKSLSPALRIAYLVVPDVRAAVRVSGSIRATAGMASPITAALATRWIEDGTAASVCKAIAREATARRAIAAAQLPPNCYRMQDHGYHLWLLLPSPWTRSEFASRLRSAGIGVVGSDAFALGAAPEAVRIGLGGAATRQDLTRSLHIATDLLNEAPALSSLVV
ncbi:PLP-dependent aminotransferase family protein [Rhizobium sp. BK251]|uniref:aminotransferase-like domain-containing protein n=1 Tax=Rhizobium sp. BK251 TaxID=2512125 RepID=UPI00105201FC|nr:PLP-dependent aminotransferase family protein [Rhizobium sp. BK251]TCL71091.1 GntR family transcriptional regulator [Rhizobium sp. BK251]